MKRKIKQLKIRRHIWYAVRLITYYSLFAYILANIILSQSISPLYFAVMKDDESSSATFLRRIRHLPQFDQAMRYQEEIYGEKLRDDVFKEELGRKQLISKLEYAYNINPKAREVLYGLSKLYEEDGNKEKAEQYLHKAKGIDPMIENNM